MVHLLVFKYGIIITYILYIYMKNLCVTLRNVGKYDKIL